MSTPPTTSTGRPLVARRMNASEQLRAEKKPRRLVQLLIGLTGYGTASALLVGSGLGPRAGTYWPKASPTAPGCPSGWPRT
jgi:hypothetical protein